MCSQSSHITNLFLHKSVSGNMCPCRNMIRGKPVYIAFVLCCSFPRIFIEGQNFGRQIHKTVNLIDTRPTTGWKTGIRFRAWTRKDISS
jgi:hypothetical protein